MPSPALGSFLRRYSSLALDRQDKKEQQGREDFNQHLNLLLRGLEDPRTTEAGRKHIGGLLREQFKSISGKGKFKNFDIVGAGEGLASLYDTEISEQRTAAGQAPAVSQQIPEDEQGIAQLIHGLSGGPTGIEPAGGEREITAAPGGGELVSEAQNPFMRSREDMLSEGMDMQLSKVQEYVDQGLLDPAMAGMLRAQIITKMQPQQPRAPAPDPLIKAYPEGGDRGRLIPRSQAGGMYAEASPKDPSTDIGEYLTNRTEFHSQIRGLDPPEAQLAAQRDADEREATLKEIEELDLQLKQALLGQRQASQAGASRDRAGAAIQIRQFAERQADDYVALHIESLQNSGDTEVIARGNALAEDRDAQREIRNQFRDEILAAHGVTGSDLDAIIGSATSEAAAAGVVGRLGQ